LPKDKIIKSLPYLVKKLGKDESKFSKSILTTDAFVKQASSKVGKAGSIVGFAKGAGMIAPNMATMLGFILTDLDLPVSEFRKIAKQAVDASFNSISVDGCMSTNDTVFFATSKKVPLKNKAQLVTFSEELEKVCLKLAKLIVKDGEGATKLVEIQIKGAKNISEAKTCGLALSNSNLFKCSLFGGNADQGRIVANLGQIGVKVGQNIGIKSTSLKKRQVKISIDLKRGNQEWSVYTCDLTPEYIKINAS